MSTLHHSFHWCGIVAVCSVWRWQPPPQLGMYQMHGAAVGCGWSSISVPRQVGVPYVQRFTVSLLRVASVVKTP